jgi:hypothetical protein
MRANVASGVGGPRLERIGAGLVRVSMICWEAGLKGVGRGQENGEGEMLLRLYLRMFKTF